MVLSGQWNVSLCSCPADAGRAPSRCRNFPAAAAVRANSAGPENSSETRGAVQLRAGCESGAGRCEWRRCARGAGSTSVVLQTCRRRGVLAGLHPVVLEPRGIDAWQWPDGGSLRGVSPSSARRSGWVGSGETDGRRPVDSETRWHRAGPVGWWGKAREGFPLSSVRRPGWVGSGEGGGRLSWAWGSAGVAGPVRARVLAGGTRSDG